MKVPPLRPHAPGVQASPIAPVDKTAKSEFEQAMVCRPESKATSLRLEAPSPVLAVAPLARQPTAAQHALLAYESVLNAPKAKKPPHPAPDNEARERQSPVDACLSLLPRQEPAPQERTHIPEPPVRLKEREQDRPVQAHSLNCSNAERTFTGIPIPPQSLPAPGRPATPSGREHVATLPNSPANLTVQADAKPMGFPSPALPAAQQLQLAGNKEVSNVIPKTLPRTTGVADETALSFSAYQTPGDKLLANLQGTSAPQALARDLTQLIETLHVHLHSRVATSNNTTVLHVTLPTLGPVEVKLTQATGQLHIDLVGNAGSLLHLNLARSDLLERLQKLTPEHTVTLQFSDAQQDSKHGSRQRRHVFEERDDLP